MQVEVDMAMEDMDMAADMDTAAVMDTAAGMDTAADMDMAADMDTAAVMDTATIGMDPATTAAEALTDDMDPADTVATGMDNTLVSITFVWQWSSELFRSSIVCIRFYCKVIEVTMWNIARIIIFVMFCLDVSLYMCNATKTEYLKELLTMFRKQTARIWNERNVISILKS